MPARTCSSSHRAPDTRFAWRYRSSLLYRMATNLCLNRLRDRRPKAVRDGETTISDAIARIEEQRAGSHTLDLLLDWLFARHPAVEPNHRRAPLRRRSDARTGGRGKRAVRVWRAEAPQKLRQDMKR